MRPLPRPLRLSLRLLFCLSLPLIQPLLHSEAGAAGSDAIAPAPATPGWDDLWHNRIEEARSTFQVRYEQDSRDLDAGRGLVISELALGNERAAIEQLDDLAKSKQADARDFLLFQWVHQLTTTTGKDEKRFQSLCQKLAGQSGIDPLDRRVILDAAATYALLNGDGGTTRKIAEKLNRITAWSILGPFDNASGSGHTKNHIQQPGPGPHHGPARLHLSTRYTGKAGLEFTWQNPIALDLHSDVNFYNHFERSRAITAYAGCRLRVKKAGTYLLSLCKHGALTAELDSQVLFERDEVSHQRELDHFEIELEEGEHTLVLKVSGDESSPFLSASLSALDGRRPRDVTIEPLVPGTLMERAAKSCYRTLPLAEKLASRLQADSLDVAANFWQLLYHLTFELEKEGQAFAVKVADRFPESAMMQYLVATAHSQAGDADRYRTHMQRVADLCPHHAGAVLWQSREAIRKNRYSLVDSLLTDALSRSPQFTSAHVRLISSYEQREMTEELVREAETLKRHHPDLATPYEVLADYHEARGDQARAKRLRREALKRRPRSQNLFVKLLRAFEGDDSGETVKQLKKLVELFPDSPEMLAALAQARLLNGDILKGIEISDRAASDFPYSAAAQRLKADLEDLRIPYDPDRRPIAIKYYERVLELNPGDFEARDKLRRLRGEPVVSEILPPIDLNAVAGEAPEAEEYPGEEACVVLDERRRIVFDDGTHFGERALVVKIFDDRGVERFGSIHTGVNPLATDLVIKEAQTLKPDGNKIRAETFFGSVAFRSLAPGDLIELHYTTSFWSAGKLNLEFWDSHVFQWRVPCLRSRFVILAPADRDFQWILHNYDGTESDIFELEQKDGGFEQHAWTLEDIPARRFEAFDPETRDIATWLDVSSIGDWSLISEWYRDLSERPSRKDPRIRTKVEELIGEVTEREEQIAILYDFVANQVAYEDLAFRYSNFVPERAPDVLSALYGDCKDQVCLLRSMLAEIDVESYFALVSPSSEGVTPYLPSPRFNHTILAIPSRAAGANASGAAAESALGTTEAAGAPDVAGAAADKPSVVAEDMPPTLSSVDAGYVFFDPTAEGMPSGKLPLELEGTRALIVAPGSKDLVTVAAPPDDREATMQETEAEIDETHSMRITRTITYSGGDDIAHLRSQLRAADQEERDRYLISRLGIQQTGFELLSSEWRGLEPGADAVVVSCEGRLENAVTASGPMQIVRPPWNTELNRALGSLVATTERRQPLDLHGFRIDEAETLVLRMPPGVELVGTPDSETRENPHGHFAVRYEGDGRAIRAHRRLSIGGTEVTLEEYGEFKEFLEGAIRAHEAPCVLKGGSRASRSGSNMAGDGR